MRKYWTTTEEATRLGERFIALKKQGTGQAEFARTHKIPGGASMVSQHIKARRPMTLEAATIYAKAFGCSLMEISPRLAKEVAAASKVQVATPNDSSSHQTQGDPFAILRMMYEETPVSHRKAALHAALLAFSPYMDPRTAPPIAQPDAGAPPASTSSKRSPGVPKPDKTSR